MTSRESRLGNLLQEGRLYAAAAVLICAAACTTDQASSPKPEKTTHDLLVNIYEQPGSHYYRSLGSLPASQVRQLVDCEVPSIRGVRNTSVRLDLTGLDKGASVGWIFKGESLINEDLPNCPPEKIPPSLNNVLFSPLK